MTEMATVLARGDLLAASRLHNLATFARRGTLAAVCATALIVAGVVYILTRPDPDAWIFAAGAFGSLIAYYLLIFLLAHWIRVPLAVRRQFREQRNIREPYVVSCSERGYVVRGLTIHPDVHREHYFRWHEDARVLLLYQSSRTFQFVPERAVPDGAIDEIRGHLTRAGVPDGRIFLA